MWIRQWPNLLHSSAITFSCASLFCCIQQPTVLERNLYAQETRKKGLYKAALLEDGFSLFYFFIHFFFLPRTYINKPPFITSVLVYNFSSHLFSFLSLVTQSGRNSSSPYFHIFFSTPSHQSSKLPRILSVFHFVVLC